MLISCRDSAADKLAPKASALAEASPRDFAIFSAADLVCSFSKSIAGPIAPKAAPAIGRAEPKARKPFATPPMAPFFENKLAPSPAATVADAALPNLLSPIQLLTDFPIPCIASKASPA